MCRYNRKGWQEGGKFALGGGEGQLGRRTEGRVQTRDVLLGGVKKPWFLGMEESLEGGSGTALGVGRVGGLGRRPSYSTLEDGKHFLSLERGKKRERKGIRG